MSYRQDSIEGRLLDGDPEAIGTVSRWVASVLVDVRFWNLRREWHDLHQDAMTGVLASLRDGRFDRERDFRSYVMAVARFTLRQAVRRRRNRGGDPEPLTRDVGTRDAPRTTERAILRGLAVRRALTRLPPECRDLIQAYFFEQRDAKEIATGLGIPIGTVKSRLFRCLEAARRDLRGKPTSPAAGKAMKLDRSPSERIGSGAKTLEDKPHP